MACSRDKSSYTFIWYSFYLLLFVDSINGYYINENISLPIGQIYKSTILFILILMSCNSSKRTIYTAFLLVYLSVFSMHLSLNVNIKSFPETYAHLSKFIIVIYGYVVLEDYVKVYPDKALNYITKIFVINIFVIIGNILLGLMNIGYKTYDDSVGLKGFFYAINELSGVVIVLYGYMLFYTKEKYKSTVMIYYIVAILLFISTVFLGTKAAAVVTMISIMYVSRMTNRKKNIFLFHKLYTIIVAIAVLVVLIYVGYRIVYESGILDRWSYYYDNYGLSRVLMSGRDIYWEEKKNEYIHSNLSILMLGLGDNRTVEMDPFDALLNYGIIGFVMLYSFWAMLIIRAYRKRKTHILAKLVLYVDCMVLLTSSFAGHMMYSGMLGLFISMLNSLVYIPDNVICSYLKSRKKCNIK